MRISLLCLVSCWLFGSLTAQPVDTVGVIYVGFNRPKQPEPARPVPAPEPVYKPVHAHVNYPLESRKDVIERHLYSCRIPLNHQKNVALRDAIYPKGELDGVQLSGYNQHFGFVEALLKGIKSGSLVALHPHNLDIQFTYQDYLSQLQKLNKRSEQAANKPEEEPSFFDEFGVKPEPAEKTPTGTDKFLVSEFELIIEKGVTYTDSRPYSKILYLQLLYDHDLNSQTPNLPLLVIPYHLLKPFLEQMHTAAQDDMPVFTLDKWLETERYMGRTMKLGR